MSNHAEATTQDHLKIVCDGGTRSNQNPDKRRGYGSFKVFYYEHLLMHYSHIQFGNRTNNESEYLALINALFHTIKWFQERKSELDEVNAIYIYTDSQLVVNQLAGNWKVGSQLKQLNEHAKALLEDLKAKGLSISFRPVRRKTIVHNLGH
jgi:ribonuclease HI